MRKFYFVALLMLVSSLGIFAQESDDSMVIEMQDGSKITLTINDVKEIVFQRGQISVPGNELLSLPEKLAKMSSRIDSLANVTDRIIAERPVAPQVRINPSTFQWEISNDGGVTWMATGVVAKGQDGKDGADGSSGIIRSIIVDAMGGRVRFVLTSGSEFIVPLAN